MRVEIFKSFLRSSLDMAVWEKEETSLSHKSASGLPLSCFPRF